MKNEQTVGTVRERERERVEFRKTSFFCDAKKEANIFEKINSCINKTDYQKALENVRILMLSDSLFFR